MLRHARPEDLPSLTALLPLVGLPCGGVEDAFPAGYVVAEGPDGGLLGAAGLEVYGVVGLLRSVAVHPSAQGRGLGGALVADRLAAARAAGLTAVYLLTTTAPGFFAARGFAATERASAPAALQAAPEFASLCPASATLMVCAL